MMRKHKKKKIQKQSRKTLIEKQLFFLFSAIVVLVITVVAIYNRATNPQPAEAAYNCQKIILPAYFYPNPTTLWDKSVAAAPTMNMMIVDPANGPGTSLDVNYVNAIKKAKDKKVLLLGYVTSSYAKRTTAQVEADIDKWRTMYGITDIFIDEATTSSASANITYYKTLYDYIKLKKAGAKVVLNPGVASTESEAYMAVSDVLTVFEGPMSTYKTLVLPTWVNKYAPSRFLHLVYGVTSSADMYAVMKLAQAQNLDYIYITNDVLPNPWDTLPPYFDGFLTNLKNTCANPTPIPASLISCTVSGNTVTWTWTAVSGAVSYNLKAYGNDGSSYADGSVGNKKTFSLIGKPGTTYNAKVQAIDASNSNRLWSSTSSCTTAFGPTSKPPTITSLTWTPTSPHVQQSVKFTVKGTDLDSKKVTVTIFVKKPNSNTFEVYVPFGDVTVTNGSWTASSEVYTGGSSDTFTVYAEVIDGSNPAVKTKNYTYTVLP